MLTVEGPLWNKEYRWSIMAMTIAPSTPDSGVEHIHCDTGIHLRSVVFATTIWWIVARLGLFVLCFIFSMFDDMNSLRKDCMTKVIDLLINNIIGIQLVYMVLQLIMIFWIFTQTYVSQWLVLCVLLCRLLFVLFLLVIVLTIFRFTASDCLLVSSNFS